MPNAKITNSTKASYKKKPSSGSAAMKMAGVAKVAGAEGPKKSSPRGYAAKRGKGGVYGPAPGKGRPANKKK